MKLSRILTATLALSLAFVSCQKEPEKEKDTTPAELKSVKLLAADNEGLSEDIAVEAIAGEMIIRVKGGGVGKTFTATLEAGENDVIKVNDEAVSEGGKASFDATFPVDITVTNSKSELVEHYVLKIGKILEIVGVANPTYKEDNSNHGTTVYTATSPSDGKAYVLYNRKKITTPGSGDTAEAQESNNNLSVIKWNGSAFEMVTSGLADNSSRQPVAVAFDFDPSGTAYVLHYGEKTASIMGVKKFNGTTWDIVGTQEFGEKVSTSFGDPEFWFDGGKPGFAIMGNGTNNKREAYCCYFDGSEWKLNIGIAGLPTYKETTNSYFYKAAPLTDTDQCYVVTSSNYQGYYLYSIKNNTWTKIVESFMPEGETYGVPSNLTMRKGPDGKIYIFAALSAAHKMQIYRFNESTKTFETFADALEYTAGSSGAIAEPSTFFIRPDGTIVVVKIGKEDSFPYFCLLDSNRRWTEWTKIATPNPQYSGFSATMLPDGTVFGAFESRLSLPTGQIKDGAPVNANYGHLESFTIGLEADILPE